MPTRHLRVVRDGDLPRSLIEYLRSRDTLDIKKHFGDRALWLWAAEAYGIVTRGSQEADIVHCAARAYVPVEYSEMRTLTRVDDINDWTQGIDEVAPPARPVAVFRVRDEAISDIEWLEQSPDGVCDYAEVAVAIDASVTLVDDEEYQSIINPVRIVRPSLTIVK